MMNVWVRTVDGELHTWLDVEVTFDTTVVQIAYESTVTTFPLTNVINFCTSETS